LRILISFNQKRAEAGASALFKKMLYYVQTTREMLAAAAEVGAKPFLLFQYYLTWQTASEGIKPPLARQSADLGLEKNAICNLRARLIKAGWIRLVGDEMNNHSQKMNDYSQKMNESFTKNERLFTKNECALKGRELTENKQLEITKNKQRERENAGAKKATRIPSDFALSLSLISWSKNFLIPKEIDLEFETEKFRNFYIGLPPDNPKAKSPDWEAVWKNWILRAKAYFEKQEKQNGKSNQSNKSNGRGKTNAASAKRTNRDKLADYGDIFAKYESENAQS
jgi:hypothetical protein